MISLSSVFVCFNTQPHEGGCNCILHLLFYLSSFNTQPHEGGCAIKKGFNLSIYGFNTQPHEGGCLLNFFPFYLVKVSTHSRTKAAAFANILHRLEHAVSTHSRTKAAAEFIKCH